MARRDNHYELALEALMLRHQVPFMPIDEGRRAQVGGLALKNPDFVVYRQHQPHLIVEVKGRKVARAGSVNPWATKRDAGCSVSWQRSFGEGFSVGFGFLFQLASGEGHFRFDGREYQAWWLPARNFIALAHQRSESWGTLTLGSTSFRKHASPLLAELGIDGEAEFDACALSDEIELASHR